MFCIIGNFTITDVSLSLNDLVVFEEGVFKEMLQQMVSAQPPNRRVYVDGSIYSSEFDTLHLEIFH